MSEILPPARGESLPEDFEGKVNWVNQKVTELLSQGYREDKSLNGEGEGVSLPIRVAIFSASLEKVLEIADPYSLIPERSRSTRLFPCVRENSSYAIGGPRRGEPFQTTWEISDSGDPKPSTFVDAWINDHELSVDKIIEIINAPDAELVPFREVFPDRIGPR